MVVLFFWGLALCALDAYMLFRYHPALEEPFKQKMLYFLGGYIAFPYNLCFPWLAWFMAGSLRPALIGVYVLLNLCTVARMLHVDRKRHVLTAWMREQPSINYARRVLVEKISTAAFMGISAYLFHALGILYG